MLSPEYGQGSMGKAKNGQQNRIIKTWTITFLLSLQLWKEEELAQLDELPGQKLYGNRSRYASLNPGKIFSQLKLEHPTEDFSNAETGPTVAEIKEMMGEYHCKLFVQPLQLMKQPMRQPYSLVWSQALKPEVCMHSLSAQPCESDIWNGVLREVIMHSTRENANQ